MSPDTAFRSSKASYERKLAEADINPDRSFKIGGDGKQVITRKESS
jgi:hypothetical protein